MPPHRQTRPRPDTNLGRMYDRLVAGETVIVTPKEARATIDLLRMRYDMTIQFLAKGTYRAHKSHITASHTGEG